MNVRQVLLRCWQHIVGRADPSDLPRHLIHGRRGERAAKAHLSALGYKFLTSNFSGRRGEIDLIFREADCLVFVEVKTRSSERWSRPAAAVNRRKRRRLSLTALDYVRTLRVSTPKFRFDIVEVLLEDGRVRKIRHLPDAFPLEHRHYYPGG